MNPNIPDQFFGKLKNQQQTEHDHVQFTEWLRNASEAELEQVLDKYGWYFESLADEPHPENNRLISLIENKINETEAAAALDETQPKHYTLWPLIKRVVAAAVILGAVCLYYYTGKQKQEPEYTAQVTSKIVPGGNKAILTLADGSTIILDSAANGTLASQNNVRIYKAKNGQLVYDASHVNSNDKYALALNTIATPRGGQYQVVLPDGSKVWLNANLH
jgi:transmembrane sensor